MRTSLLILVLAASPSLVMGADINVNLGSVRVDAPGVSITFGSRNDRGYYWDGHDWRDPDYWRRHDGPRGERYYTGRPQGVPHQGEGFCPPGQAKKGRC